jgi:hypothetical protein
MGVMIVRADHTPAANRADRGAAMVEFVGIIFVAAVLMAGVAGRVAQGTEAPQAVWWGICSAYRTAPGFEDMPCQEPPSQDPPGSEEPTTSDPDGTQPATPGDRAEELSVPCVASQVNRVDNINAVAYGIRVGTGATDEIRINADGTATVSLSETTELGVEAAIAKTIGGKGVKGSVSAVDNGEFKYTYNFPDAASAKAFLDERRNLLARVTDTVVPGSQTINELSTRLGNWLQNNVGDKMPWVSDADRAAHAQQQANRTADAVSIAVGTKANANAKIGNNEIKGQVEAELSAKGEALVNLDPSKGSSFTATIEGKAGGGVSAQLGDPKNGIGALFGVSGIAGAKGAYKVAFDSDGKPTQLVVTREFTGQVIGDATLGAGGVIKVPAEKGGVGGIYQTTWTLDLTDPANLAAFNGAFTVGSVSAGDYTGAVALPNLVLTSDVIEAWKQLGSRMDADSYEANYTYVLGTLGGGANAKDYEIKEGVFGAGLTVTETGRILVDATGYDHRTGGPTVPLATCE